MTSEAKGMFSEKIIGLADRLDTLFVGAGDKILILFRQVMKGI